MHLLVSSLHLSWILFIGALGNLKQVLETALHGLNMLENIGPKMYKMYADARKYLKYMAVSDLSPVGWGCLCIYTCLYMLYVVFMYSYVFVYVVCCVYII